MRKNSNGTGVGGGSSGSGGVKVTMVEVLPANKVQQIKKEPVIKSEPSDSPAESKPVSLTHKNGYLPSRLSQGCRPSCLSDCTETSPFPDCNSILSYSVPML